MTTTVCETLCPTTIPDVGRVELIATLPAGELYSVALRWTHAFNGDLSFSLRAPGDSFATLFSALGGASAGGDLTLRDGFPALTSADLVAANAGPFGRADGASTLLGFAFSRRSTWRTSRWRSRRSRRPAHRGRRRSGRPRARSGASPKSLF